MCAYGEDICRRNIAMRGKHMAERATDFGLWKPTSCSCAKSASFLTYYYYWTANSRIHIEEINPPARRTSTNAENTQGRTNGLELVSPFPRLCCFCDHLVRKHNAKHSEPDENFALCVVCIGCDRRRETRMSHLLFTVVVFHREHLLLFSDAYSKSGESYTKSQTTSDSCEQARAATTQISTDASCMRN